jgi:hypothetical protein
MLRLEQAINAYHALLDDHTARDTYALLADAIRARGMLVGYQRTRLICEVLRPRFVVPTQYATLQRAAALVGRAIQKVGLACLHDATLLERFRLTPNERALLEIDPGYAGAALFGRLDGFLAPDGAWCFFVESNLESPAGIAYEDALVEMFNELPVMQAFVRDHPVEVFTLSNRLHRLLREAYAAWGGVGAPNLAIVDFRTAITWPEFAYLRDHFSAHGTPTIVADPDELHYDGHQLWARQPDGTSWPIAMVYRRVLSHEFLARYDLDHPLVRAYADGKVCVVNPWRTQPVHTKLLMALLSDEAGAAHALLDAEERAAVAAHVPWSREVRPGPTHYQGTAVADLIDFVARNRERLVLKPNDSYGGSGVVLGWQADEAAWRATLGRAATELWVVQERVPVPEELYPTWDAQNGLQFTLRYVDSDPCVFGVAGEVQGCLTRIAGTPLLNVSAGGGAAPPTFLLRPT